MGAYGESVGVKVVNASCLRWMSKGNRFCGCVSDSGNGGGGGGGGEYEWKC